MAFAFLYIDAKGDKTERHVNVDTIGPAHIVGFCRLRKSRRTFRIDRIVRAEMVDTETGEIIDVLTGEIK
ncbi:hypothetical protein [Stenotrophomonas phage BUCT609]|uniref:WYL domain-containing protein n=1 Tax=Stenotrophomonas phage BUCT609 TaxID=2834250 RepID=A0A8E6UR93_9CAUD|nr:hypothetical protein [Stenotrophomonas phage BUCT609]